MKEYKISSFTDLMQVLKENPQWLEELRRIILPQELLGLPKKFAEFRSVVGRRFEAIEKKGKGTKKNVSEIRQRLDKNLNAIEKEVQEVKRNFNEIKRKLDKDLNTTGKELQEVKKKIDEINKMLDKGSGYFRGLCLEMRVRENASSFFSEYLLSARVIDQDEIKPSLFLAIEKEMISKEEMEELCRLDLIVEGSLISTKDPVLVAVEVSCKIEDYDVQRAVRRAEILEKATNRKALPAVVGYRIIKSTNKLITETGCLKVLVSE
jgi:hypothetical protein